MIINNVNKETVTEEKTTVATETTEETEAVTDTAEATPETAVEKAEATAKKAEEATGAEEKEDTTTGSVELEYTGWDGFTRNMGKMGLGMLGIFVVIGIIIIATSLLNKIKNKD